MAKCNQLTSLSFTGLRNFVVQTVPGNRNCSDSLKYQLIKMLRAHDIQSEMHIVLASSRVWGDNLMWSRQTAVMPSTMACVCWYLCVLISRHSKGHSMTVSFSRKGTTTQCLKKVPTFKLSVTLSNLNWLSKFLYCYKAYEIFYKTHTTLSTSP